MKKRNSETRFLYLLVLFMVIILPSGYGQVTPFQKSVMDSIEANSFNASIALGFNASHDATSSLTTSADVGLMYSTERSNFQLVQSSYFNRYERFSTDNRFIAMATASLFSHDSVGNKLIENKVYPEPFVLYSSDIMRALNWRWQFGVNTVYAFKPTRILRIKTGVGLLYEMENWQMVKHELVPYLDTLPDTIQKYLFETIGISKDGKLRRNNIRANAYANMMCAFTKNINLNAFIDIQMPFVPPYKDLPQIDEFPVVTKLYPRISFAMDFMVNIFGSLSFITHFAFQFDKGQIPLYAPNFMYNVSEGLQLEL